MDSESRRPSDRPAGEGTETAASAVAAPANAGEREPHAHAADRPCRLCEGHRRDRRLLSPARSRWSDLASALRIGSEILRGFMAMRDLGPSVTVFGSARTPASHGDYALARQLGRRLAEAGFTVITGGGPGIMEAANRSAREAEGRSAGCNIRLLREQAPNRYLDTMIEFDHFFARKLMLVKYSCGFAILRVDSERWTRSSRRSRWRRPASFTTFRSSSSADRTGSRSWQR